MGTNALFILFPIIILFGVIYGMLWAVKKSKNSTFDIPMVWFYNYTYVLLPLTVLWILWYLLAFVTLNQTLKIEYVFILLVLVIFLLVVIMGLAKFKIWGWRINILLIIVECISFSFFNVKDVIYPAVATLISLTLLWFLPNFIYFKKRKKLFS